MPCVLSRHLAVAPRIACKGIKQKLINQLGDDSINPGETKRCPEPGQFWWRKREWLESRPVLKAETARFTDELGR